MIYSQMLNFGNMMEMGESYLWIELFVKRNGIEHLWTELLQMLSEDYAG